MSVLQLFVLEKELDQIIRDFAVRRKLTGCLQIKGNYHPYDPKVVPSELLANLPLVEMVYLFPESTSGTHSFLTENVRPINMGWIQVEPGNLHNTQDSRELVVSTIQAENKSELLFKAGNWLRQLKKDLSKSLVFGVKAENVVHGGSGVYQDMAFSQEALSLYQSGVYWKQPDVKNIEFSPSNL